MKIAFRRVPFTREQRDSLDRLAAGAGYETVWYEDSALPEAEALKDIEILMGYFPPEVIKGMPALKWLQTPCAGVERWCGDIYRNPEAVLTNGSGAFGVAIAEFMLTGLLMLMRNMPAYMANQRGHIWRCAGSCRSIYGSTITVVGMGDIGSRFAERAKALGTRVRGVRRTPGVIPEGFDEVYAAAQLKDAVRDADAVVMCLPGTPETTALIDGKVLESMSSRAIVVNCGRGCTLDQDALIEALRKKRIAGAVLDVFAAEPLPADSPLWDMDNVIITPHISGHDGDPINAQAIYDIFHENLRRYFAGEPMAHVVDRARGY